MVRIRITAACTTAQLNLQPGDEILVKSMTPEVQALLNSRRIVDDEPVAEIVRGGSKSDTATTPNRTRETTTA